MLRKFSCCFVFKKLSVKRSSLSSIETPKLNHCFSHPSSDNIFEEPEHEDLPQHHQHDLHYSTENLVHEDHAAESLIKIMDPVFKSFIRVVLTGLGNGG